MKSELVLLRELADCVRAEEKHIQRIARNVKGTHRLDNEDWGREAAACRKEGRVLRRQRLRLLRELRKVTE